MGWPKLHETERGAAVRRIFWEAGFLPRPADASFASVGGMAGGAASDSKITKVLLRWLKSLYVPRVPDMKFSLVEGGRSGTGRLPHQ